MDTTPNRATTTPARLCAAAAVALLAATSLAQPRQLNEISLRVLPGTDIQEIIDTHGGSLDAHVESRDLYLLRFTPGQGAAMLGQLVGDSRVVWAEFNHAVAIAPGGDTQSFFVSASIQQYHDQYSIDLLGLEDAHDIGAGDGRTVAVLDTGVSPLHPMLLGNLLTGGYNFIDNNDNTSDDGAGRLAGHGTVVAGMIVTVAPDASILPVTVLSSDGAGSSFVAAQGVYHAIDNGAHVVNLSFSTIRDTLVLREAVDEAVAAGITVVASAGNRDRQFPLNYPAALPGVLAVAGTDDADVKEQFSDYGEHITLSAPAWRIVGPFPDGGYVRSDGTSFAAGFVSGAAALLGSVLNDPTSDALRDILTAKSIDIDPLNPDHTGMLGEGRLDALSAAREARRRNGPAVTHDPTGAGLLDFMNAWLRRDPRTDINGDGVVDSTDLLDFLQTHLNAQPGGG